MHIALRGRRLHALCLRLCCFIESWSSSCAPSEWCIYKAEYVTVQLGFTYFPVAFLAARRYLDRPQSISFNLAIVRPRREIMTGRVVCLSHAIGRRIGSQVLFAICASKQFELFLRPLVIMSQEWREQQQQLVGSHVHLDRRQPSCGSTTCQ